MDIFHCVEKSTNHYSSKWNGSCLESRNNQPKMSVFEMHIFTIWKSSLVRRRLKHCHHIQKQMPQSFWVVDQPVYHFPSLLFSIFSRCRWLHWETFIFSFWQKENQNLCLRLQKHHVFLLCSWLTFHLSDWKCWIPFGSYKDLMFCPGIKTISKKSWEHKK